MFQCPGFVLPLPFRDDHLKVADVQRQGVQIVDIRRAAHEIPGERFRRCRMSDEQYVEQWRVRMTVALLQGANDEFRTKIIGVFAFDRRDLGDDRLIGEIRIHAVITPIDRLEKRAHAKACGTELEQAGLDAYDEFILQSETFENLIGSQDAAHRRRRIDVVRFELIEAEHAADILRSVETVACQRRVHCPVVLVRSARQIAGKVRMIGTILTELIEG